MHAAWVLDQHGPLKDDTAVSGRAKVAVSPGLGFGEQGEGYVRIALVENNHRLRQAVRNVRAFLQAGSNVAAEAESPAVAK